MAPADAATATDNDHRSYLALVPRGLHHAVLDILEKTFQNKWTLKLEIVGESSSSERDYSTSTGTSFATRLSDQLAAVEANGKRSDRTRITTATCRLPVGSVILNDTNQHTSLGYSNKHGPIWTGIGQLQGSVWVKIVTDAPVDIVVNSTRCIGPLLALVNVWQGLELDESKSLDETVSHLERKVQASDCSLGPALSLWEASVKASWSLSDVQLGDLREKLDGQASLRYRLSCFRSDSQKKKFKSNKNNSYTFTRQQLLSSSIADLFVPKQAHGTKWTVDLEDYDVEVALLMRSHCLAVGLALRPYKQVGAKSFAAGVVPPDINPPYISGSVSSGLVRLRPSTANILLHLAQVQTGDVVIDPCAGVGTIPMESLFGPASVIAFGGDLVLTPASLGPIAASYSKDARTRQASLESRVSSIADVMAWDAANIPLRTGIVDVVVTDLPFGQLCLSASQLDNLLPLIVGEASRLLRRETGRMVLLCGTAAPVLNALLQTNGDKGDIWQLPCSAVFPVNIGGLLAWIVQVNRGKGKATRVPKHFDRLRKLTSKRERKHLQATVDKNRSRSAQR